MPNTPQTNKPTKKSKTHGCKCMTGYTGENSASRPGTHDHPCSATTAQNFAQGHDARIASRLAIEVSTGLTDLETAKQIIAEAGGTPVLVGKMTASAARRKEEAARKANKPAKTATASTRKRSAAVSAAPEIVDAEIVEDAAADTGTDASSTSGDVVSLINDALGDTMVDPQPGDVRKVVHGKREFQAVVTEVGGDNRLKLVHDIKGGKSCVHELSGAFLATVGRLQD